MNNSLEAVVKHMIKLNNHNTNISFPALVVNTSKLDDGFIDVNPVVNYTNPLTADTIKFPTLMDVRVVFPSSRTSSICFPLVQGDTVLILVQSTNTSDFINGNVQQHDPDFLSYGDLSNVVALVGFTPYQDSCFSPNNYKGEFNNQDLNIVHNKNTDNEAIISINTDGDISLKSPTKVIVESKEVQVISDRVEANSAVISTDGDVEIQGKSVKQFMDSHTHTDAEGRPTSTPNN